MDIFGRRDEIPYSKCGEKDKDEKILLPYIHIIQVPCDTLYDYNKIFQAFNYWAKISYDDLLFVADIIKMFVNAVSLLDDIEDNSSLRRGFPAAHTVYGIPCTMNAANYAMFLMMEKLMTLNKPEALRVYCDLMLDLHQGQGMEIYWRDNYICPSEQEYMDMSKKKSGGFLAAMMGFMQLFSENKTDFTEFLGVVGVYLQIVDDYGNLCLKKYADQKGYCGDLTEGKFTLPVIHAINSQKDDGQIMSILRERTTDAAVKARCVELLDKCGSLDYTRRKMQGMDAEIRAQVKRLGGNPAFEDLMDLFKIWEHEIYRPETVPTKNIENCRE